MTNNAPSSFEPGRRVFAATLAAAALSWTLPAIAQQASFPGKPIRMVVSVAAGGATDAIARRLGERLSKSLGQPVFVENMPRTVTPMPPPDGIATVIRGDAVSGNVLGTFTIPNPMTKVHNSKPIP